ncbi:Hypothetical Protein FCC1311_046932 [Hondaea fermentalgiana]|uniref:Uncharacterized protein n=1 Tax=Hondaea fermentalgiana TaxID=2315210 RepID=A0A2R5GBV7_9STRA|nr:Hypothetical Protein FCC1311_046932 [Hondaea fermentalgiana]|eukprot:GBG28470.1 Hypothetical Protein FCC1311_046932 [Hondaea fermentalgiana]
MTNQIEDYKSPPSCCCKLCCPPCAVYFNEGCCNCDMILACFLGCFYTMFCWEPKHLAPKHHGAPEEQVISR